MLLLLTRYQQLIDDKSIIDDPIQRQLLATLQTCYDQLTHKKNLWQRIVSKNQLVKGVYLWGGVGIGKTFVMDLFYDALPFQEKMRNHFHGFMQGVQEGLRTYQGAQNPLELVASDIANKARVLCFDEFFVSDIADAMILERLFSSLFAKGVVLIATSNIAPENLYLTGLHRRRFLPAIALIESHSHVIDVKSHQDYRFRTLEQDSAYFKSQNKASNQAMLTRFNQISGNNLIEKEGVITIEHRQIQTRYLSNTAIWFDFNQICHTPRSQVDYLKITEQFTHVFISDVPIMSEKDKISITYFIYLVDVFYDKHIKLFLSAETSVERLYEAGDKLFEYQRTISRLHEMQSKEWLNKPNHNKDASF